MLATALASKIETWFAVAASSVRSMKLQKGCKAGEEGGRYLFSMKVFVSNSACCGKPVYSIAFHQFLFVIH